MNDTRHDPDSSARTRKGSLYLTVLTSSVLTALALVGYQHFRKSEPGWSYLKAALGELPDVQVVTEAPPDKAYQREYDFNPNADWFSHDIPVWQVALAPYKGKPKLRYLEVGIYEGRSAMWILDNILTGHGATYTGIDVFLEEPIKNRFLANVKKAGAENKVTVIIGPSQVELRKLPVDSFDIVYIDGSHSADDVLEDCILSWRLVKPDGLLIFDDYRWDKAFPDNEKPKIAIDTFMRFVGHKHFDVVHNGYQLMLKKRQPAGDG